MTTTSLTPAGRSVLEQLVAAGGKIPDYLIDSRPLFRLEDQGFITCAVSDLGRSGQRPRTVLYVVITEAGRAALREQP